MNANKRFKVLRQLPCCWCGRSPSDVAHSNWYEHGKGKGVKANDEYTIPMCREHHNLFDTYALGVTREQSKAWFMQKWEFINGVISEIQAQN